MLKQALEEAQALYSTNIINDSLSRKLLYVADLLEKRSTAKQQLLSYNRAVTHVLQKLLPKGEHIDYAYSLDCLAGAYQRIGNHQIALIHYQQALTIKGKTLGEDNLSCANNLHNIADIYFNRRLYDKALSIYEKELSIKGKQLGQTSYEYVECLISLSWSHNYLGHYDTALLLNQRVLVILDKIPKEKHNASEHSLSLMNIARLYHRMGQYDRSLFLYDRALAIKKQTFGEDHFEYGIALLDVGYFHHMILGNYDTALCLYEKAQLVLAREAEKKDSVNNDHSGRPQSLYRLNLTHLGSVNYLMGRYDKAFYYYQKAFKLFPRNLECMTNLARAYYSLGQQDSSLFLCRKISDTLEKTGQNSLVYAKGANDLGVLFYNMGNYNDALHLFESASRITKETFGKQNLDYANTLNSLGMIHTALGNDKQSAILFDEATNITLEYLSRTYSTLSEQEKIAILTRQKYQFDFLPSLLLYQDKGGPNITNKLYENVLALKGMVSEDQQTVLSSIRKSGDSSVLQLYLKWYKCKAFVGMQHLLPLDNRALYLDSVENVANQLEQELSRHSVLFRNQQTKALTVHDLSQKLLPGEAAIEFIRFQLYKKKWTDSIMYAALVLLPGDSIARFIPLFEERQIQNLLRPYAGSTTGYYYINRLYGSGTKHSTSTHSMPDSLYKLIWKPLEIHLAGSHTIYYAPAGLLHSIALKALKDDSGHFLIEKYRLNQVLSTRSVVTQAEELQKPLSASVWGHIDYDFGYTDDTTKNFSKTKGLDNTTITESIFDLYTNDTRGERKAGWPSLSNTKKEMDSIKKVIEKSVNLISFVSGRSATEEAFKALNGTSPQLLHVATHGFFLSTKQNQRIANEKGIYNSFTVQQNPMFRSGIVLAGGNHAWKGGKIPENREDGILTAYEIAQLDLSNIELLVLSACETALGETKFAHEGVFGLQRAFKLAGVKKMIVSLWQVPDKQTMELITLFYNNWLGGQTIREALHNAQLEMKKRGYSPFYWAAFVVVE